MQTVHKRIQSLRLLNCIRASKHELTILYIDYIKKYTKILSLKLENVISFAFMVFLINQAFMYKLTITQLSTNFCTKLHQ